MLLKDVWRDLKLTVANSYLIPFLWSPINLSTLSEHKNLDKFLTVDNDVPNPVGKHHRHADRWFYANGVMSDRQMWLLTATMLSTMFGKKIEALFNPSKTVVVDVIEVFICRFRNTDDSIRSYYSVLRPILENGETIHVIAHSQGGLIMSETIQKLIDDGVDVSKLNVYTFGSAHVNFDFPQVYSEHFANEYDYISKLGTLEFGAGSAPVHKANNMGHLINAHYLPSFAKGDYCGGKSRLYSYLIEKPA